MLSTFVFNKCSEKNSQLKAAPWDDINFRFLFCNEVVYPMIL